MKWLVTDPKGIQHHVEEDDGHLFGAENVHVWVQAEIKKGHIGKVYGWKVELKEDE